MVNCSPKGGKLFNRAFGDISDEQGGHGTHVVGSIAGSSINGEYKNMHGMAPDAKIAFYDVGHFGYFVPTSYIDIFEASYQAGARVHSNSWGSNNPAYGPNSYDIDYYLSTHPDFAIFFSAGNDGPFMNSLSMQSYAKNAISVGAGKVRNYPQSRCF